MRLTADNLELTTDIGKNVLQRVKDQLLNRFDVQDYHLAASVLDPNMKNLPYLEEYVINNPLRVSRSRSITKKDVLKNLCSKFRIEVVGDDNNISPVDPGPVSTSSSSNVVTNTRQELLSFLMEEEPLTEEPNNNFKQTLDAEIDSYLNKTVKEKIQSTVDWWKMYEADFPRLKKLNDAFLSIPPSSASSERAFKKSSKVLTQGRSNLGSMNVNMMCFINSNITVLEEFGEIHKLTL